MKQCKAMRAEEAKTVKDILEKAAELVKLAEEPPSCNTNEIEKAVDAAVAPKAHDSKAHDSKDHDCKAHDSKAHDSKAHDSKAHDSKTNNSH